MPNSNGPATTPGSSLLKGRDREALMRFIDAVSPFVRDVLDEPFPWKVGGQVTTWMSLDEYEEAVAALEALRD